MEKSIQMKCFRSNKIIVINCNCSKFLTIYLLVFIYLLANPSWNLHMFWLSSPGSPICNGVDFFGGVFFFLQNIKLCSCTQKSKLLSCDIWLSGGKSFYGDQKIISLFFLENKGRSTRFQTFQWFSVLFFNFFVIHPSHSYEYFQLY